MKTILLFLFLLLIIGCWISYAQQKILINENMVCDGGGGDGRSNYAMWYFDQLADPASGINTPDYQDGDAHDPDVIYRPYDIRLLEINLQKLYKIDSLFGYQKNQNGLYDTLDIYLSRKAGRSWYNKLKSNLRDSTPDYRVIQNGTGPRQWKRIVKMNDTAQYIIIVIRNHKSIHPIGKYPIMYQSGYSDFIFYGTPTNLPAETTYNYISHEEAVKIHNSNRSPLKRFNGVNQGNNHGPISAYANMHWVRWYRNTIYWDEGKYPNNRIKMQPQQEQSSYSWVWHQIKKQQPGIMHYPALTGPTHWVQFNQFGKDIGAGNPNMDSLGMSLMEPSSYRQYSYIGWAIAGIHGTNEKFDTAKLRVTGGPKIIADSLLYAIQGGNEQDFPVFYGLFRRPIEMVAQLVAVYDGAGNTMGPDAGVKNGDPNMKVIYPAFIGWNYRPMLAVTRWSMYFYEKRKVPWDINAGHLYYTNKPERPTTTQTDRIGGHGMHPGLFGWQDSLDNIHIKWYQWYGSYMPLIIDENGYDKTFQFPKSENEVYYITSYGVPRIDSYDSTQVQAILLTLGMIFQWRTSSAGMVQFWGTGDRPIGALGSYQSSEIWLNIQENGVWRTIYWPGFYSMNGLSKKFGEYVHYKTVKPIGSQGSIYELRGKYKDSILVIIGLNDTLSKGGISYKINVSDRTGTVKEWPLPFNTLTPIEKTVTVTNDSITTSAMVMPKFFYYKQASVPSSDTWYKISKVIYSLDGKTLLPARNVKQRRKANRVTVIDYTLEDGTILKEDQIYYKSTATRL